MSTAAENQPLEPAAHQPRFRFKRLSGASAVTILTVVLVALFVLSFLMGRYPISIADVIRVLLFNAAQAIITVAEGILKVATHLPGDWAETLLTRLPAMDPSFPDVLNTVVIQLRLPRVLAAMLIGGGLAVAGASFQGLFRNPLVSPDILGVSSGASLGAIIGILVSGQRIVIELLAFGVALLAVGGSYGISRIVRGNRTLGLILAGMAIGSLLSAFLSLAKYAADPTNQLPTITYWLMGSLSAISFKDLAFVAAPMLIGIGGLLLIRWRLNVLAMGEDEAKALGTNTGKLRAVIVICCTVITASAVAISGTIGWIGLIIPHIGRMLVGPDHKKLIPVSLLIGAIFLLLMDDIARTMAQVEIPIGILTAIMGVPFFLYLLARGRRGWA
ncbi:MAG: iron ABC transporter permease [Dehalococcoidia bacterium]|nr:iron ABC transporter permease [Dehalococcoidia bacterium]